MLMVSKEKIFLMICFLILPNVANMGVTDVIVTVFYNVLNGLFLTDNNYYIVVADLIANVVDVIATC